MAVAYKDRSAAELQEEYRAVKARFDALKSRELKLNMSRGKPSKAQLDMVSDIMDVFKNVYIIVINCFVSVWYLLHLPLNVIE